MCCGMVISISVLNDVGCVYYQQSRFKILKCQMSINRKSVLNKNHKKFFLSLDNIELYIILVNQVQHRKASKICPYTLME